jgi:hypothetical protein
MGEKKYSSFNNLCGKIVLLILKKAIILPAP